MKTFLFLHETLYIEKYKGTDFENGNSFFSNSSLKIPKYDIFSEKSNVFSFYVKICVKLILLNST